MLKRKFYGSQKGGKAKRARYQGSGMASNRSWFSRGGSSRGNPVGRPTQVRIPGTVGVAGRTFVKLSTHYWGSITSTAGAFSTFRIAKLNSVTDPTGTLSSIKAIGYTQWAGMYHSYLVHSCKVKLDIHRATNDTVGMSAGMYPSTDLQTAATTAYDAMGQPFAVKTLIAEGTSSQTKSISKWVTIAQVCGVSKEIVGIDSTFASQVGSSPATGCSMNVWAQTIDASTTGTIEFQIQITQWVEFFGPKLLTQT